MKDGAGVTDPLREPFEVHRVLLPHEPIGEGAMGEVVGAVDSQTGQRLAIKILHRELARDPGMVERFREEAEITAAVDHAGGIPVFGLGNAPDGRPFYVMKRIEGRTLSELLGERGTHVTDLIWRQRLLAIFGEICEAVGFAHARGIVHRDLKPDNVLVDEQGSVTVVDWGLAKRTGRALPGQKREMRTYLGEVLGSPGYMAPEQASGDSVEAGPPADVFALGAILYEILTGTRPFQEATLRASMLASIHRHPKDPSKTVRWLSHSLAAVCRKALEKDPARRYANAGDLARDLRSLRLGLPATAARPSWYERFRWAVKRRPVLFTVIGVMAGALVISLLAVAIQFQIDSRLAAKAFARIAQRDLQVEALGQAVRELDRARSAADGLQARRALELKRIELDTRQLLLRLDSIYLLRDVHQLRFIRRDPQLAGMIKARAFDALRSALDLREPALAKALAGALAERGGEMALSAEEAERLRVLTEEADRAFDEAIRKKP